MGAADQHHAEDDDWGQPGTLVRECSTTPPATAGQQHHRHPLNGVTEPVLQRAFQYWKNVDKNLGDKVEQGVRDGQS